MTALLFFAGLITAMVAVSFGNGGGRRMRLRHETDSSRAVIVAAMVTTSVLLAVFGIQTLVTAPETFSAMVGVLLLAVVPEYLWSDDPSPPRHARIGGDRPSPAGGT